MIFVGVDPGKDGALAFINFAAVDPIVRPMPLVHGAARDEYDGPEIAAFLFAWATSGHVFIEKLQPLPAVRADGKMMGGTIANFNRGAATHLFIGLCVGMKLPYTLVSPRTWQKVMLADIPGTDTKQRSILAAQRLFPNVDLRRTPKCKKPHDGIADALLIAEYGRRLLR